MSKMSKKHRKIDKNVEMSGYDVILSRSLCLHVIIQENKFNAKGFFRGKAFFALAFIS